MIPGPNRNVSSTANSSGRCHSDPGRDSPYALRAVTVRLSAVPAAVMKVLTRTARVITPPEKICRYAAKINPIVRGWANYYRGSAASRTFAAPDHYLWQLTCCTAGWGTPSVSVRRTGEPPRGAAVGEGLGDRAGRSRPARPGLPAFRDTR